MVVPVIEHPGPAGKMPCDALERHVQYPPFRLRQAPLVSGLQAVLDEVGELPKVEPPVEGLPESHALVVPGPGAADLQHQELVDGLAVPPDDFRFRRLPDPVPKADVPQVLQQHQPLLHPVAMDRRHPGPRRLEKPVHVQEGELIERFAEHR